MFTKSHYFDFDIITSVHPRRQLSDTARLPISVIFPETSLQLKDIAASVRQTFSTGPDWSIKHFGQKEEEAPGLWNKTQLIESYHKEKK